MSWAWTKLFVDLPVLGLEYEIKNSDRLVSSKPCVIVSNHQSSLDVIGMETFCYRPQTKFGARKYFHRCLSVCPQGGGGLPDRDPPGQKPPLDRNLPCTVKSGWYASYWNAFLFYITRLCYPPIVYSIVSDYKGHEFVITAFREMYFYVDFWWAHAGVLQLPVLG